MFTVTVLVAGNGSVTSSPAGIACPGACSAVFSTGTSVTLTAQAMTANRLLGWDGSDCSTAPTCMVDRAVPTIAARFTGAYNVVFASTTLFDPSTLTLAAADAACAQNAMSASLPGTYRAWLSTTTVNAITRLGTASGWITVDGLPFAATRADLVAGTTIYPPRYNSMLQVNGATYVTGTANNGTYSGFNCNNWTSLTATTTAGYVDEGNSGFTNEGVSQCSVFNPSPVLCLGTDYQTPVQLTPQKGRIAFLSITWFPGGGLADADAFCQADATAAGLPGTYKALLAHTGGTAQDRFSLTGPTWVRVDGVRIVPSAAMLGSPLLAPISLRANGTTSIAELAYTGNATTSCNDWTDTSSATVAGGQALRAGTWWSTAGMTCNQGAQLYCLQE
jgi:hypothetical protein